MKCPVCNETLHQMKAGDLELDVCSGGCGGIWFDRDEIFKIDEKHEFPASPILEIAQKKSSYKVDHAKQKTCPKCENQNLARQFFDIKNEIEIDQCYHCAGIWLDIGELNGIREQYKTYEERAKAVNTYVDENIAETTAQMKAEVAAQVEQYHHETRNIFSAFLFGFKKLLGADDLNDGL